MTTITTLVLPPYSAGGAPSITSMRLHGVDRNLIREDLALLVGDGLAVDREGVGSVIAESVKQAVRIGRDARRGQRHQRTERRGLAFERQLVEQRAIDVGVGGRDRFRPGRAGSTVTLSSPCRASGRTSLQRHRRAHVHILLAA